MRLGLGYQVLIAVIAGIFCGLFLGPMATVFKPVASIYIMLLQMVVLPYISISIIHGLGSLTPAMAKQLLKKGWLFWLLLWGLMFYVIFLLNHLIPKPLFSSLIPQGTSLSLNEALTKNILTYLVPENPIYDFVNNIVPSIAVFGVIVGLALMHIEKKEPLLSMLERGDQLIEKILKWLALISPIGVFAHISVGMGTVNFAELGKLEFYVVSFVLATVFLTFWILPLILSSFTPLSFRESLKAFRNVCLLSFVTGISTIAIPFINQYLHKLGERYQLGGESGFRSTNQTIVPISYSFAQIGNCLLLFFIFFASFYFRHPFTHSETSLLALLTIPLSIGSSVTSINAVAFLFKELNFPDHALDIFTQTMPVTMNFQVLLSVAGVLTFTLLVLFANYRLLQIKWKELIIKVFGSLALLTAVIFIITPMTRLEDNYRNLYPSRKITDTIPHPLTARIYRPGETFPDLPQNPAGGVLDRVLQTGVLRVGYDPNNIPYTYMNSNNELVGFDIAMAYQLAQDLNCRLEFIPENIEKIPEELNAGLYDLAVGAILMTEERIQQMSFTDAYADQNNVLLIRVKNETDFANLATVQSQKGLVINAVGGYKRVFANNFPNATLTEDLDFEGVLANGKADADIWSHIPATIWCMNHTQYTVKDYAGQMGQSYFAYAIRQDALTFLRFVNNWIQLKILDEFYQEQSDYWIMGAAPKKQAEPRWSIIRNVLHWVN